MTSPSAQNDPLAWRIEGGEAAILSPFDAAVRPGVKPSTSPVRNPLTEEDIKPLLLNPEHITVKDEENENRGGFGSQAMEMPDMIHSYLLAYLQDSHMFNGQLHPNLISINFYVIAEYVDVFLKVLADKGISKPKNFWVMPTNEGMEKPGGVLATIYMFAPEDRGILNQLRVKNKGILQDLKFVTGRDGRVRVLAHHLRIATKLATDYGFQITNMS